MSAGLPPPSYPFDHRPLVWSHRIEATRVESCHGGQRPVAPRSPRSVRRLGRDGQVSRADFATLPAGRIALLAPGDPGASRVACASGSATGSIGAAGWACPRGPRDATLVAGGSLPGSGCGWESARFNAAAVAATAEVPLRRSLEDEIRAATGDGAATAGASTSSARSKSVAGSCCSAAAAPPAGVKAAVATGSNSDRVLGRSVPSDPPSRRAAIRVRKPAMLPASQDSAAAGSG